jgi:hypothetical protein
VFQVLLYRVFVEDETEFKSELMMINTCMYILLELKKERKEKQGGGKRKKSKTGKKSGKHAISNVFKSS